MEFKNNALFTLLSLSLLCFNLVSATSRTPNTPIYTTLNRHHRGRCDGLRLGLCADVIGMLEVVSGSPPMMPCCSLLLGLVDLEAALCLCTVMKGNILGANFNVHIKHTMLLNNCGRKIPIGFICS
uniref:Hydrophobic seed protein domain-containing protein n=1 Tax=Daucus carota subsp. sativus TaxID=79200 RepID=A0A175YLP8_DAUCS